MRRRDWCFFALCIALIIGGCYGVGRATAADLNDWRAELDGHTSAKFLPLYAEEFALPRRTLLWRYNPAGEPATYQGRAVLTIARAMARWSAACGIRFVYMGTTTYQFADDGASVYSWARMGAELGGYAIARIDSKAQALAESDVALNADTLASEWALFAVALHETGHAIGIAHSDVAGATMSGPPFTAYAWPGILEPDDVAACHELYGSNAK